MNHWAEFMQVSGDVFTLMSAGITLVITVLNLRVRPHLRHPIRKISPASGTRNGKRAGRPRGPRAGSRHSS
jgi:hypothetical protein